MPSASFAPLRHTGFAIVLSASFVSSTGTWMQSVALGVYLTQTTHNTVWLGLVTAAAWVPSLVGSPLGGLVADRWNRQRWIQINNVVMAVAAALLATAEFTGHLSPTTACALAVVEGLASAAAWPAMQSLLPDLVDRSEVLAAVSLSSAQFNLGRVIGPVLAALTLTLGSPGWCFAINAATFVFVVVAFLFVPRTPRPRVVAPVRLWGETVEGARRAWSIDGCRYPIIAVAVVAVTVSPFIALVPAMAIEVLRAGKVGTSWLVSAQGVGAVVGAVTLPGVARRTSRVFVLRLSIAAAVLSEALYAFAPSLSFAMAALVVLGAAYVGTLTGLITSVQLHAPVRERSRILSLYTLSLSVAYPLGAVVQATVARWWGVRVVTGLGAGAMALVVVGITLTQPSFWAPFASASKSEAQLLAD